MKLVQPKELFSARSAGHRTWSWFPGQPGGGVWVQRPDRDLTQLPTGDLERRRIKEVEGRRIDSQQARRWFDFTVWTRQNRPLELKHQDIPEPGGWVSWAELRILAGGLPALAELIDVDWTSRGAAQKIFWASLVRLVLTLQAEWWRAPGF